MTLLNESLQIQASFDALLKKMNEVLASLEIELTVWTKVDEALAHWGSW